jgi:hypothetical protein
LRRRKSGGRRRGSANQRREDANRHSTGSDGSQSRSTIIHRRHCSLKLVSGRLMRPLGALIGSLSHRASRRKTGEAKSNASPARLTPEQADVVSERRAPWRRRSISWATGKRHEVETVLDRIEYGVYS